MKILLAAFLTVTVLKLAYAADAYEPVATGEGAAYTPIYTKLDDQKNRVYIIYLYTPPSAPNSQSTSVVTIWDTVDKKVIATIPLKDINNNNIRADFLLYTKINGITYSIGVVVKGDVIKYNIIYDGKFSLTHDTQWVNGGILSLGDEISPSESTIKGKWVVTVKTILLGGNTEVRAIIINPQNAEVKDLGTKYNQNSYTAYGADPTSSQTYLVQVNRDTNELIYYSAIPLNNEQVIGPIMKLKQYAGTVAFVCITGIYVHVLVNSNNPTGNAFVEQHNIILSAGNPLLIDVSPFLTLKTTVTLPYPIATGFHVLDGKAVVSFPNENDFVIQVQIPPTTA